MFPAEPGGASASAPPGDVAGSKTTKNGAFSYEEAPFLQFCGLVISACADKGTPGEGSLRPNKVWPTFLRFFYHRRFRTLRSAPKGAALGTRPFFEKKGTKYFCCAAHSSIAAPTADERTREPPARVPFGQTEFGLPSCAFLIIEGFALCGVRPRGFAPWTPTTL